MTQAGAQAPTGVNRREFLNYAWLASMVMLMVNAGGVSLLFAFPRFREGEFGGLFELGRADNVLPPRENAPVSSPSGRFWLVNLDQGVLALYKVCTHLGCLYNWSDSNFRFECPCHGSKFEVDGAYIKGPAPRSLDRFVVKAVDDQGNELAISDAEGNPVPVPPDARLLVDTGQRILGKPKGQAYPGHVDRGKHRED
jgi:cytochrome b6-f complex iron-sulfur subunit